MQKRGSTEILATILIVGIAVSLFTFIFISTKTNFSNVQQTVQRSIDTSRIVNFRVLDIVADDASDKLKILIENDQDTQIYGFEVNIYNKDKMGPPLVLSRFKNSNIDTAMGEFVLTSNEVIGIEVLS